jgi:hypothetical protein
MPTSAMIAHFDVQIPFPIGTVWDLLTESAAHGELQPRGRIGTVADRRGLRPGSALPRPAGRSAQQSLSVKQLPLPPAGRVQAVSDGES